MKVDNEVRLRTPVHTIGGIVCFGQISCSPYLMGFCAENSVAVSFLTENGVLSCKDSGAGIRQCPSAAGTVPPGR